jgi:hypothetical protein
MQANTPLFNSWIPSHMDGSGGSGPGADAEVNDASDAVVSVDLDIDLLGIGPSPEPPVPIPDLEQQVPCSLAITIMSLCLTDGALHGERVKIDCRKASMRRLGEAEHNPLHSTQMIRLGASADISSGVCGGGGGEHVGVGEMFTMAGTWGDLRGAVLEFDLTRSPDSTRSDDLVPRPDERFLANGVLDVGAAIRSTHPKCDLAALGGAMRVRTLALVDQCGRTAARLSVMLACNLSLDFPQCDPEMGHTWQPAVCAL